MKGKRLMSEALKKRTKKVLGILLAEYNDVTILKLLVIIAN